MRVIDDDWYRYPRYYDIAFRGDLGRETRFLARIFREELSAGARILEPACGSGRLVATLAAKGFDLVAFDRNDDMLEYARTRLRRRRLSAELFRADMTDFKLARRVDGAFNLYNSFRHLLTEADARSHLRCVARALRPGGLYVLGLHLYPSGADLDSVERWSETSGKTKVNCHFRLLSHQPKKRIEQVRTVLSVREPRGSFRVRSDYPMRTYTPRQMKRLLASVPEFELLRIHDFWFDPEFTQELDEETQDALLILRRRSRG